MLVWFVCLEVGLLFSMIQFENKPAAISINEADNYTSILSIEEDDDYSSTKNYVSSFSVQTKARLISVEDSEKKSDMHNSYRNSYTSFQSAVKTLMTVSQHQRHQESRPSSIINPQFRNTYTENIDVFGTKLPISPV